MTVPKIIGVALESTNLAGYTDAVLAFGAGRVYINFVDFDLPVGTYVSIDVSFVPEPGAAWLLGPALLAGLWLRRRGAATPR